MRGLYKYLRMKKICCIGHITLDKIITPKSEVEMPGGTSFYFAHGIHNLNPAANFQLVTAVAQSEMKSVDDIRALGVDVVVLPTRHTVFLKTNTARIRTTAPSGCSPRPTRSRCSRFRE